MKLIIGDEVEIIGKNIDLAELAAQAGISLMKF